MAQEDIIPYEEFKAELEDAIKIAKQILPFLRESKLLQQRLRNLYIYGTDGDDYIAEWINNFKKEELIKLEKLEKYMNCAHIKTEETYDGHDSHKDYYQEVCLNCGKIIKHWSV